MRRSSVQVRVSARIYRLREAHDKCASLVFMYRSVQNAGCFSTAACFCKYHGCVKTDGRFCLHLTQGRNLSIHAGLEGLKNKAHISK